MTYVTYIAMMYLGFTAFRSLLNVPGKLMGLEYSMAFVAIYGAIASGAGLFLNDFIRIYTPYEVKKMIREILATAPTAVLPHGTNYDTFHITHNFIISRHINFLF